MRIGTWLLQNSQWAINHSFKVHTGNYGLCNKVIDFNGTLSELCFRYRFFIIKFQRPTFVRTFEQSVLQGHRFHWSIGTLRVMGLWTTGHSGGIGTRENSVCFSQTLTLEMKIIYFSVDWKVRRNNEGIIFYLSNERFMRHFFLFFFYFLFLHSEQK